MARLALLMSGLPRQWAPCIASQFALFKNSQTDVFFHFWDYADEDEKKRIVDAYKPKAYKFEPQVDTTGYEKFISNIDNINSPSRLMSQYYSWKAVGTLFREYLRTSGEKYDLAVRLRCDLMFFTTIDHILPQIGPNDMILSQHNNFDLVNDMWALGGVEPILYYHTMFDRVMGYAQAGVIFNPELLLIHHLKNNPIGMRIVMSDLVMLVFRPHMLGMSIEECLKEHPGRSKWRDPEIVKGHMEFHERRIGTQGVEHVERFRDYQLAEMERLKMAPPPGQGPQFFYRKPGT